MPDISMDYGNTKITQHALIVSERSEVGYHRKEGLREWTRGLQLRAEPSIMGNTQQTEPLKSPATVYDNSVVVGATLVKPTQNQTDKT